MIQSDTILTRKTNSMILLKLESEILPVIRANSELLNHFIIENKFWRDMLCQISHILVNKLNVYFGN